MSEPPNERVFQRWGHSNEEDDESAAVYRPDAFPFPPARGREWLELRPDGVAVEWRIGRGDAPEPVTGHWSRESQGRVRVSMPGAPNRIVEFADDVLRVRPDAQDG